MARLSSSLFFFAFQVLMLATFAMSDSSSLSVFWQHELPHTAMPESLAQLASPLSPSSEQSFLSQLGAGSLKASHTEFCSAAKVYCSDKAVVIPVSGVQPRVCVPPFLYEYGVLPCRPSAAEASAVQTSGIFFTPNKLVSGKPVQLPDTRNDLQGLRFLPSSLGARLPAFDMAHMLELTAFYGVEKGSDMELDMKNTLAHCSFKSEHELRACQSSGEGIVKFVTSTLGHYAVALSSSPNLKEEGIVQGIAMVSGKDGKLVVCHDMKFPSIVYSCHMIQTSQLMDVSVKLATGDVVHKYALCHTDTSYWNPTHIAFQALNVKPGSSAICHWFPEYSFIFVDGPIM